MKKNKKALIAVICCVVVIAIVGGLFGAYFSSLNNVPERVEVEERSSSFYSKSRAYAVSSAPYCIDGVFETLLGLESYYNTNRHNASVIDVKLQQTRDGQFVVFSDELSTYSNASILYEGTNKICDLTLEELRKVNLAYNYADENGQYFYKPYTSDEELSLVNILTVEEFVTWFNDQRADLPLFAFSFYNPDEIADKTEGVYEVNRVFTEIGFPEFFFFCPDSEDTAKYIDENYPEMLRSATEKEAKKLFVNCLSDKPAEASFEIVYTVADNGFFGKFSSEKFIAYAKNSGIALILKDIDTDSVKALATLGVDGFVSSDLEKVNTILKEEYRERKAAAKS
ncbi:MAG: hypothetical protein IJB86_10630 [Clostridia bacterium]|nr:hypothetical protein [Clostridia bacterium]